jgi:hypothetical protein
LGASCVRVCVQPNRRAGTMRVAKTIFMSLFLQDDLLF